jgi:hypothetical protein
VRRRKSEQIVVERETLHVVRVDTDFGHEGRGRKELHFYARFGYDVVGGCEGCKGREEKGKSGGERAHRCCVGACGRGWMGKREVRSQRMTPGVAERRFAELGWG